VNSRRRHLRFELREPAYIACGGASWKCTVVNMSAEGAAIEVLDPAVIPGRFLLMIAKDRRLFHCRLAWTQQNRVGASFEPDVAGTSETGDQAPPATIEA
jgi:hypothetical protein